MKQVLADSVFWIAIIRPDDPYEQSALEALDSIGQARLITTEEVLTELCAAVSRSDSLLRRKTVQIVRRLLASENVRVIAQSHDSFLAGLELYEKRADKWYSLTDGISMNTMLREGVSEVLTNDHHFRQEGFRVLMKG
jgi:predicted nucleic acid-binding protein